LRGLAVGAERPHLAGLNGRGCTVDGSGVVPGLGEGAINFLRLDLELVGLTSALDDQSTTLDNLREELRRLDDHRRHRPEQDTDRR
jgi:hypothetical protein